MRGQRVPGYKSKFSFSVSSGQLTYDWHQLEVGIITGCTITVTLFMFAMNIHTSSASGGEKTRSRLSPGATSEQPWEGVQLQPQITSNRPGEMFEGKNAHGTAGTFMFVSEGSKELKSILGDRSPRNETGCLQLTLRGS